MKKLLIIAAIGLTIASCQTKKSCCNKQDGIVFTNFKDSVSYLIGNDIGRNLKTNKIDINPDLLIAGIKDAMGGKDTLFTQAQFQEIMTRFQKEMQAQQMEAQAAESATNKAAAKTFLDQNRGKEGVMETASGLQYKVLKPGYGDKPGPTSKVKVHYEGRLIDGKIFDSSYERGEPISFELNKVIKGWTEGLQLMPVGSTYELYIKPDLGYGDRSMPEIPAGSLLIFKVELLGIE